jgi:hypothetical protein
MVNKKFLVKDGLKRVFQTKCGLSLLLAACIFNGCASWPTEGPSGFLTITGIPSEYEGKFVKSSSYVPIPKEEQGLFSSPKEVARGPATAITNGELKLPLYGKEAGYFGSDTANVCFRLRDTAEELGRIYGNANFDFIFADVQFEDGVKELKWDDQVRPGFITVTNLPAEFANNTGATVYIGNPDYELKVTVVLKAPVTQGTEATCTVDFPPATSPLRGIGTGKFFTSEYGKYRSFPQSGTRDVIVQLSKAAETSTTGVSTLSYTLFRFKAARIDGYRIHLDLSEGIRQ